MTGTDWLEDFAFEADVGRACRNAAADHDDGCRVIDTRRGAVILFIGGRDNWAAASWTPRAAVVAGAQIMQSAVRAWFKGRRWRRRVRSA